MTPIPGTRKHFYYSGGVLLLALVIGGGTGQGLWTDHLIQLVLLPALFMGLGGLFQSRLEWPVILLVFACLACLAFQFLPFSQPLPGRAELEVQSQSIVHTLDIGRSIEASLFFVTAMGYALYLARFSTVFHERLLSFLMLGVIANIVIAMIQLSFSSRSAVTGLFPFSISAGLFANENHFAAMVYGSIPLFMFLILIRFRNLAMALAFSLVIMFVLFALGSRSGIVISLASCALCIALFYFLVRSPVTHIVMGVSLVGVFLIALLLIPFPQFLGDDLRAIITPNTLAAIPHYLQIGRAHV